MSTQAVVRAAQRQEAESRPRKFRSRTGPMLAMLSPVTLTLILFVALPLCYVLLISFCSTDESHNIVFRFTLENYKKLLDPLYLSIYGNSLLIAGLTTVVCILTAYPFAYIMANSTPLKKTLLMMLLMLPFWTNSLIRIYGWRTILGASGVLNSALMALGIVKEPIEFLFTPPAVILGMVYTLFPFMVLPVHTSIDKLDRTLLEAAADLGAKRSRAFVNVTLPLTLPGIFAGTIMVFIPTLGFFFVADLMGGGKQQLIGNLIERQFKEAYNWPLGAALSIILIAVTLALVGLYRKTGGDMENLV